MHTRRGQGNEDTKPSAVPAGGRIIAALSVHSRSGAKRAPGNDSRSSESAATPPTTAIARAPPLGGRARPLDEGADDRALVRRSQVGLPRLRLAADIADGVEQRRLDSGEGEVEPVQACDRKRERVGIAVPGQPVNFAPAGIAETEQPRALVERLAGGVVDRGAEDGVAGMVLDVEQQGVAAAREEAQKRRLDPVGTEEERGDVAVQVVDRASGRPRAQARAFAAETPTRRAPMSPGPCVTAIVSTSSSVAPASSSASRTTGTTSSRCRRDATSGTTPP